MSGLLRTTPPVTTHRHDASLHEDGKSPQRQDGVLWDRIRYTLWAPIYDALVGLAGFADARRRSIDRLDLREGDQVLLVGAGTGLDLDFLPPGVTVTAVDVTPAMLGRLERRAARAGRPVAAEIQDARRLAFPDASFDAVVLHLILAVMPQPELCMKEVARVLRPGGRVAIFDKFLRAREAPSRVRRLLNLMSRALFSDINRRLEPLLHGTGLVVEDDEPASFGGAYRIVTLSKPVGSQTSPDSLRARLS
jgi:SAM-dependent methyltransferase